MKKLVTLLFVITSFLMQGQSGVNSLEIKTVSELSSSGLSEAKLMVWDSLDFGKVKYINLDNTIRKEVINTTPTTLSESDILSFKQFYIDASLTDVTITIPVTSFTYATDEIKFIIIYHEGTGNINLQGDVGVTFTSQTFSQKHVVLYSTANNVWTWLDKGSSGGSSTDDLQDILDRGTYAESADGNTYYDLNIDNGGSGLELSFGDGTSNGTVDAGATYIALAVTGTVNHADIKIDQGIFSVTQTDNNLNPQRSTKLLFETPTVSFTNEIKIPAPATSANYTLPIIFTDGTNNAQSTSAGVVDLSGLSLGGSSTVLDEDDFASDSATEAPSQQSVKAYGDANWASSPTIINTYFVSEASGDLETAITNLKALDASESKIHTLVIDQDVNITGSPRTITVDVPVYVQRGFKFITPDVTRNIIDGSSPVTGTVSANYVVLQIDNSFYADKDVRVFEGDGIIYFGGYSVDAIESPWYGLIANNTSTAVQDENVKALTKIGITIVTDRVDRATSKVKIPNGITSLNSPVVFAGTTLADAPFLTGNRLSSIISATMIKIEGASEIKHGYAVGDATTISYTANWGAPFIFHGLRNSSVKNIKFDGLNDFTADDGDWMQAGDQTSNTFVKTVTRPDEGMFTGDVTATGWIRDTIEWGIGKPYSAIITDPFRVAVGTGGAVYDLTQTPTSTIDLYYSSSVIGHQNSWDVKIENLHVTQFVEGITIGLTGQQNDTFLYNYIMFDAIPIGISQVQDQSRDCKAYEVMAYSGVWAAFDTTTHGLGVLPEIMSFHSAGGLKYLHHGGRGSGIINISNVYAESIYGVGVNDVLGDYYEGMGIVSLQTGSSNQYNTGFPATILNSTFKIGNEFQYTRNGVDAYLLRPPTIKGFNIIGTLIGAYGTDIQARNAVIPLENSNLMGYVAGQSTHELLPVDKGWTNNPQRSTLRREQKLPPNYTSGSSSWLAKKGYGFESGVPVGLDLEAQQRITYKQIGRTFDEMLDFPRIASSKTFTYFPDLNYVEFPSTANSPFTSAGDIVLITTGADFYMGIIQSEDGTTTRIAIFNKAEIASMETKIDGSNQFTASLYKVNLNKTVTPFLATKLTSTTLERKHYATYRLSSTSGIVAFNDILIMPDGTERKVLDVTGTTVTLSSAYNGTLVNEWILPKYPQAEAFKFVNDGASFLYSSLYIKGKKYEYWDGATAKTDNYVKCVKTGDFADTDATKGIHKANFILYNSDDEIVSFIDGESLVTPLTSIDDVTTDFNYSGTTAERPDNLGFPTEYIPNGFIYNNTETVENQAWNGTTFIIL